MLAIENIGKEDQLNLVTALEKIGAKQETAKFVQGLKSKKVNKESRMLILKALDNLKQAAIMRFLKAYLKNKDPDIRCYVIQVIGKIGGKEMNDLLYAGLLDDVASVREAALDAFKNYKETEIRDILIHHLKQESEKKLREKTLEILKIIFPEDAKVKAILK